jgi:hypothetical protein
LDNSLLDIGNNFEKWSLSPFSCDFASHGDRVSLDILMEDLIIKLFRGLVSEIVRQLTTLRLNDISFAWSNAVGLRIVTLVNVVRDAFLVVPSAIFQVDETLCR